MQDQLAIFGWICCVVFSASIIVPFILRWSDLFTVWNLFLIGAINFVGYAAVQTANGVYSYGLFTNDEYARLMLGTVVFFAVIYPTYYRTKWPWFASRKMRYWPAYSGISLGVLVVLCTGMLIYSVFFPNIQFIGQIVIIVGPGAGVIGVALAFCRWWQTKTSAWLLVLVAVLLGLSLVASINGTTGRRSMLSVLSVIPLCVYWLHLRYKPLIYTIMPIVVGTFGLMVVMAGYSTIRHRYSGERVNVTGRTSIQTAVESLVQLPSAILRLQGVKDVLGGDSMEASLVAINLYTKVARPQPFFVVKYILINPVPRAWWPDKPEALGQTLPRDTGVWNRTGYVNWGPGIPGHGFHEGGTLIGGLGGYLMLAFYGWLFGSAMRVMDEVLIRQHDNPYILGMFAGASGQIIAFARGDIGLFSVLIIGSILAGLIVKFLGRLLLGYTLIYPTDEERAAAAQPQQPLANPEPGWTFGPQAGMPYAQN